MRVLSQFRNRPVYVVGSRFVHDVASNGGALSSIGVSWTVLNDRFRGNRAVGNAKHGGGSGAAIYNDGDRYVLTIGGTLIHDNAATQPERRVPNRWPAGHLLPRRASAVIRHSIRR